MGGNSLANAGGGVDTSVHDVGHEDLPLASIAFDGAVGLVPADDADLEAFGQPVWQRVAAEDGMDLNYIAGLRPPVEKIWIPPFRR